MPNEDVRRFYEAHGGDASVSLLAPLLGREERLLLPLLDARAGHVVLDAGCGAGGHARALCAMGATVWAVDLSPRLIEQVRPYVARALVADLADLSCLSGLSGLSGSDLPRFDRVLCAGVLEFVPDPARCVAALGARLAPGGRLVLAVPRPGLPGAAYALWHRAVSGITVRLPRFAALDRGARAAGLRLRLRREDPLGHNLICAWDAPSLPFSPP